MCIHGYVRCGTHLMVDKMSELNWLFHNVIPMLADSRSTAYFQNSIAANKYDINISKSLSGHYNTHIIILYILNHFQE